jgi:hypothetical protein
MRDGNARSRFDYSLAASRASGAPPDVLYHYTPLKSLLERILPTFRLRISALRRMNDPRETRDWVYPVSGGKSAEPPDDTGETGAYSLIAKLANTIRTQEWLALCLTSDDADYDSPGAADGRSLDQYARGYARPRMWAHYGDNHRGGCLVLDGPRLHAAITDAVAPGDFICNGHVRYANEASLELEEIEGPLLNSAARDPQTLQTLLREHIRKYHEHFFLIKSLDWETEREYRWLINRLEGPLQIDISSCLKSVIMGVDCPAVYQPSLAALCDSAEVRLQMMSWERRVPDLHDWMEN